jgi:predicted kinase
MSHTHTINPPNLIFPVGIPGSGKSTWARTMLLDYIVVSSDEIRKQKWGSLRAAHDVTPAEKKERNNFVWDAFYLAVATNLRMGYNVYADGTNLRIGARDRLLRIAKGAKARIHCIIFDNTFQGWERNTERDPDAHVPGVVMSDFSEEFENAKNGILALPGQFDSVTVIGALY